MTTKRIWEKISQWEQWPFALRYLPIAPVWLWYCIRSRSAWFFSSSNPTITFGGFEGEGKKEMYDQLPVGSFPNTVYIQPGDNFENVKATVAAKGFVFPVCVKPDVGMKGLLFRKLDNFEQLAYYHQHVPVEYIIQDLITYPLEVSVFYYRHPAAKSGVISGFIQKDLMDVTGNGSSTLLQLIQQHPLARFREAEMRIKHKDHLHIVVPKEERYFLAHAANLNRGARFIDLQDQVDEQLLHLFDQLSHQSNFYYGRWDIKCTSVQDLKEGKNFSILEFNGAGAEPNHVYNTGYSLFGANKVWLQHWKMLYQISKYNHKNGIPYWSFKKGWNYLKAARKHFAMLEEYENRILV